MKIWHVSFNGIYPVGAAAIAITEDGGEQPDAIELFREKWREHYPMHDPEPVEAFLLSVKPGSCVILMTGDY